MQTNTIQENESSLAELFQDATTSQDQVVSVAKAYLDARRAKEDKEAELKSASETFAQAELALLRAMDGADVKSLKVEHAGVTAALTKTQSTYYSLPAGALDDPDIMAWLKERGGADLLKQTIHHATFSSLCKELVENQAALFDGVNPVDNPLHPAIKVAERRGIMMRKG